MSQSSGPRRTDLVWKDYLRKIKPKMVHGDTSFWNSHPAKSGGCCCFEVHFRFCSHLKGNGWLQSRQQVCDLTFGGISHYIHLDLATTVTSVNKMLQDKSKN